MKPFFSVVIPTYNRCELLKRAVDSVEKQSFKDYEIIIIDNNSTDETHDYLKTKKNIIYKRINNNGVIAKSRNLGIEISRGQWVSFLDTDDTWFEQKLEETFREIKKSNFDIICNNEWVIDNIRSTKKIWNYGPYEKNFYKTLLLYGNRNGTSATSVNKNFLLKNNIKFNENIEFITAEDYEFFLNIALKGGLFTYLQIPLGIHLYHEKAESAKPNKLNNARMEVLKYHVYSNKSFLKKDKLWKKICKINAIKSLISSFIQTRDFLKLVNILYKILGAPLESFNIFNFLIKKTIKQNNLKKKYVL